MSKRKYPSELNTRTIRVTVEDHELLSENAKKLDTTVAEALHLIIRNVGEMNKESGKNW